jgi:hypothetical protein
MTIKKNNQFTVNLDAEDRFVQWFVGFSDGEASFSVVPMYDKSGNKLTKLNFRFAIGLHLDDKNVLVSIHKRLAVGNINESGEECRLVVSDKEGIIKLISIFDKYNLNTPPLVERRIIGFARRLHTNSSSSWSWFLTGFIDAWLGLSSLRPNAESCFRICITKKSKSTLGWSVRARFLIHLDQKDFSLLREIKTHFGVGHIHISPNNDATFEVSRLFDLLNVIIPFFDKYPLQSVKAMDDYILWKKCIELIVIKADLRMEGLDEIRRIKESINKGLPAELSKVYFNVKQTDRLAYKAGDILIDPFWISGYTEGDRSFIAIINTNDKQVRTFYQVGLNEREIFLSMKIQSFFGNVGYIRQDSTNAYVYQVVRTTDLVNVIIPHFNKFPLKGKKLQNFLIWSEIVTLMSTKAHLTSEGWAKITQLKNK